MLSPPHSPRLPLALALGFVLLYAVAALSTGRLLAPSGDTVLAWAHERPVAAVLCVERGGRLTLASEVDDELRRAVPAELASDSVELPGAILSRHVYNARWRAGPLDLPWMRNGYSSGLPDWIPRWIALSPLGWAGGRAWNQALGGLVLLGALLLAARLGGSGAVLVTGALLATEPQFHYYKHVLGGTEVWLQGLALGVTALCWWAWRSGSGRLLAVAALAAGLGLHVKLSFAGFLAALIGSGLLVAAWRPFTGGRSPSQRLGGLALLTLLVGLGASPTVLYHAARSTHEGALPAMAAGQVSVRGALLDLGQNVQQALGLVDSTDKEQGKAQSVTMDLLAPSRGMRRIFAGRANRSNDAARHPRSDVPVPPQPALARAAIPAQLALLFAALLGGGLAWRRRIVEPDQRLVAWSLGLAVLCPLAMRALSPDPHNLALARPLWALGLGLGAATWATGAPGRWRRAVLVALATLVLIGETTDLAALDRDLDATAGRLSDVRNQRALADTLVELGSRHPAVLEHELMSVIEAHSHGRVRPLHYARSSLGRAGPQCVARSDPDWLRAIVRAHRGDFIVLAWGPYASPGAAPGLPEDGALRAAGAAEGLAVEPERVLLDARGRWFATLWAVGDRPPRRGAP